jgi:uncharacterized protein (TIGR03435 family)
MLWAVIGHTACHSQAPAVAEAHSDSKGIGLPRFEVATIKPTNFGGGGRFGFSSSPGGRIFFGAATLKTLIAYAFDVEEFQVIGEPKETAAKRYDIAAIPRVNVDATVTANSRTNYIPSDEQRRMFQALLIDRFNLKYHWASRSGFAYRLVRGSGKLQLTEPKDKDSEPAVFIFQRNLVIFDGEAHGRNTSMPFLARELESYLDKPVLDETGIKGSYDFNVEPFDRSNEDVTLAILNITKALGLKLERGKGTVETIVIDSVTEPTEN